MFKRLAVVIASLALLSAPSAARAAEVCRGQNIIPLTRDFKAAGDLLIRWGPEECGGGMGNEGDAIPRWTCFVQYWVSKGQPFKFFYEKDPAHPGNLVLAGISTVEGGLPIIVPIPDCQEPPPAGSPLPGTIKVFPGDPTDRRL